MKILASIILILLIIIQASCQPDKKIIVMPGVGVDNLTFLDSDINDVKEYLKGNLHIHQGTGHADGIDWSCYENWTKIESEQLGLTFTFSTPCVENPDTLEQRFASILFDNTPNCCLNDGICMGISSFTDVIKKYGLPSDDWRNESFLRYNNPPLELRFDANGILEEIKISRN